MINNTPAVQLSYKFEFTLSKNRGASYKSINFSQLLVVHLVIWSVFPGIKKKKKIHFAVLILKSSFNFLGATMKSHKWSKGQTRIKLHFQRRTGRVLYILPKKMYIKVFWILSKQPWYTFYLDTLCINDYFLMYICR